MAINYIWKKYNAIQGTSYRFSWKIVCGFTGLDWVYLEAAYPMSKGSTYVTYTTEDLGSIIEPSEVGNYLSYNISSNGRFTGDITFKSNVSTVTTNIYDWEDAPNNVYRSKYLIKIVDSSQWVGEDVLTHYVPTTGKIYYVDTYTSADGGRFYLAEPSVATDYTYSQGSYISDITSTSSSTYPTNGVHSDGYWYVYQGNDNVAPTTPGTPSLPVEIKGGESISISWSAASDTNGNLSGYTLECSLDNSAWTQIYSGSATSSTYTVPLGTETIAFRVKAYDSEGAESGYATTSTYVVGGASSIAGGSVVVNNVWKALTGEGYVNVSGVWRPLVRSLSCIGAVWKESSSSGSLPSGYTQLEYIESTGTQYIDTGVYANANTKMEADLAYTTYEAGYSGTYPSGSYFMFGTNTNHEVYLGSQVLTSFGTADTNRFQISIDAINKSATVADVTKTFNTTMSTSPLSLLIFAYRSSDSIAGYSKFKLYSYKLYDNNTLAYDFVPCVTTSGLVGLYDKINNKFYGNAGTGSFTAGAAI